jgi:SAM-dependent methyltransferase
MYSQRHDPARRTADSSADETTAAYDLVGNNYAAYADGESPRLFSFDGLHAYADRRLWSLLDEKLRGLREAGARSVTILDAGCGPGTWLRRLVTRAVELGFTTINARGFDIAKAQIETARRRAVDLALLPGVALKFEVGDLTSPLQEATSSVDLTLCLYSVLSHLPAAGLPSVASELARATKGHFVTTVRAIGSTPTIFIDSIDKARNFRLDHIHDRYYIELCNGRRLTLSSHLFSANELRTVFGRHFDVEVLSGLDIFHSRFFPDRRWNPASVLSDKPFLDLLAQLEQVYAGDARLIERATHLLFVGRRRSSPVAVPVQALAEKSA